jgi:oligogalacturonide transport system substrate-binding protein
MVKRMSAVLLIALTVCGAVFAGGGGQQGETRKPVSVRFAWWGADARHEATLKAIDLFMEKNPGINVEAEYQGYDGYQQKIITQLAGGNEPDLLYTHENWFTNLTAQADIFADIRTLKEIDLSVYPKGILDVFCIFDGKLQILPSTSNGFGLMVNRDFLKKHNIPEDYKWTFQNMLEQGARIHKGNPDEHLFALESSAVFQYLLQNFLYSKTGHFWLDEGTGKFTVTKEELEEFFTWYKAVCDTGAVEPVGEGNLFTAQAYQDPKYINGRLGFLYSWAAIEPYKNVLGDKLTVAEPPYYEGGKSKAIPFQLGMGISFSGRSKALHEAAMLANFIQTDEQAIMFIGTTRAMPTNPKAQALLRQAGTVDPMVLKMIEFTAANPQPRIPLLTFDSEVQDIVKDIVEQVAFGRIAPAAAADRFLAEVGAKIPAKK